MGRASRWIAVAQESDATANDSDKTFTVPAGHAWCVRSVFALLVSTATVGNRQMDLSITDASDNEIMRFQAGATQAASLTRRYTWAPSLPAGAVFSAGGYITGPLPEDLVLPAGFKVRVFDSAAIDAAADDLTCRLMVEDMVE
jgi:hypothetical protein